MLLYSSAFDILLASLVEKPRFAKQMEVSNLDAGREGIGVTSFARLNTSPHQRVNGLRFANLTITDVTSVSIAWVETLT